MEVQAGGRISIKAESKTKFTFEIANVNMSDEREYEVTITSSGLNVTISSLAKVTVIKSNSSTPLPPITPVSEKPPAKETTFKGNNDNGKLWFTTLLENQTVLESATLKLSVTVAEKNEITENLQVKWYRRGKMLEFLYKIEQKS